VFQRQSAELLASFIFSGFWQLAADELSGKADFFY
jgi:hypothetical protein